MNKPTCKLVGENGNIFNLMGIATRALKRAGMGSEATEMRQKVTSSGSYDEALCIIMNYVDEEENDEDEDEDEDEY